ncbi:hypothetical protein [Paenibacillus medicaginis]|uniref:DUF2187 domain-containing protein n=1 Tax=Paenibacillus medicaginis TaxID=1470560 RepID=A0ABV5C192_9BACL
MVIGQTIRVINGDCKQIAEIEMEHNDKNIETVSRRYIKQYGKITKVDNSSDCLTIVTYERETLGFSI